MSSNPGTVHLVIAPRRQILRVTRSNLLAIFLITILLFAYIFLSAAVIRSFEPSCPYGHALYFTIINVTTVGFGDVYPTNHKSSVVSCVNAFVGLLFLGLLVSVISLAFQPGEFSGEASFCAAPVDRKSESRESPKPLESAIPDLLGAVQVAVERLGGEQTTDREERRQILLHVHDGHIHVDISLGAG